MNVIKQESKILDLGGTNGLSACSPYMYLHSVCYISIGSHQKVYLQYLISILRYQIAVNQKLFIRAEFSLIKTSCVLLLQFMHSVIFCKLCNPIETIRNWQLIVAELCARIAYVSKLMQKSDLKRKHLAECADHRK